MPPDEGLIADLELWRRETPYAQDRDRIFASGRMKGRQPLWPEALMKNHVVPAREAGRHQAGGPESGGGDGSAAKEATNCDGSGRYGLMCTFLCTMLFQHLMVSC